MPNLIDAISITDSFYRISYIKDAQTLTGHNDCSEVCDVTPSIVWHPSSCTLNFGFAMGNSPSKADIESVDFKIKPFTIPPKNIRRFEKYGSGGTGDVWKCSMDTKPVVRHVAVKSIRVSNTMSVAIKSIRVTNTSDKQLMHQASLRIRREAYVWIRLSHDHILPLKGVTTGKVFGKLPALVSPWMENGSLTEYIKKKFSELSDHRKSELVQQVAAGLKYLHGEDVVHGDLTGTNILVDDLENLRLTDFGLSMIVAESGNPTFGSVQTGSTRWMAPEFADYSEESEAPKKPTKEGDIYSFGCVMLQILSGLEPYHRMNIAPQILGAIMKGREPFPGVEITNEVYKLLSSQCLSKKPEERPTMVEIMTTLDAE